jgi:hypothetical protein
MSSQKSDGIVKRRAPKPRSKPIEVADDFEGAYEDFTALVKSPRAQWVTAKALHVAIKYMMLCRLKSRRLRTGTICS